MSLSVVDDDLAGGPAPELLERRWFGLLSAITGLRAECGLLLEASELADVAWRRACLQLAEFEALRDVLEEQMTARHPRMRKTSAA